MDTYKKKTHTDSVAVTCNIIGGQTYGNCSNVTINREKLPFEDVNSSKTLSGISAGARVMNGAHLSVSGIADHIIVDKGGRVNLSGQSSILQVSGEASVSGIVESIILTGGEVDISGIVGSISGKGAVHLMAGSVIGGVHIQETKTLELGSSDQK